VRSFLKEQYCQGKKSAKIAAIFVADKIVPFTIPPLCMLLKAKPLPATQREERLRERNNNCDYCVT
jgi:hypothetical protein